VDDVEIQHIVRGFICEQFLPGESPENLGDDVKLLSEGILDSLASLKLVAFLEERFGIKIEAHEVDVENLDTLSAITAMVKAKLT
jgi:acyl carrier protein